MSVPPLNEYAELTPLALMLTLMREKWTKGDRDAAVKLACAAAPYLHARRTVASSSATRLIEAHHLSDADLWRQLAGAESGTSAAADDP